MKKIVLSIFVFCLLMLTGCEQKTLIESDQYQYYYEKLTEDEKETYLKIYTAVVQMEDCVSLGEIQKETLEKIYVNVRNDHPELFWMDNAYSYTLKFGGKLVELSLSYLMDKKSVETTQKKIDVICDAFLQTIPSEDSMYQKVRKAYEFVIDNTTYVSKAENDQNIQSVFLGKESVCAGYARAFQYLLTKMDIDCAYIEGESITKEGDTLRHAWNMVCIEDNYYYVDSTWGDNEEGITHACDGYFLMDSEEMLSCYKPSTVYESTKPNGIDWMKIQGKYFEGWNEQQIQSLWKNANTQHQRYIEIKCSEDVYEVMTQRIKHGEMYEIMRQIGMFPATLYYVKNDALHMIEVFY